jgi:hypothetical protein
LRGRRRAWQAPGKVVKEMVEEEEVEEVEVNSVN